MKHGAFSAPVVLVPRNYGSSGLTNAVHSFLSERVSLRALLLRFSAYPYLDAPARLKKELDMVLALQADLEAFDRALQTACTIIEKDATQDTLEALESLERGHDRLLNKVDILYTSLNIHNKFPELHGVSLEFVRILLLARDLKMNIRQRAIGSFFEWDKLDRAVGGKQKTLGKCH